MYHATIYYDSKESIQPQLEKFGLENKKKNDFLIENREGKEIASLTLNEQHHSMDLYFSKNLLFEDYAIIHGKLSIILNECHGSIHDEDALLGYLVDGSPAYIYTNWELWASFINVAKFRSLEGNKVNVVNSQNEELASGLLVGYKFKDNNPGLSSIVECTIITLFGEKKYTGEHLMIQPAERW